ncbi:sodium:solute symporter family protein [Ornithinibacillus sp. BX22]|uniref:Sodium:solute symporter family protein n=1 Tax=Ornithinibacillus hominis TaxID=2763055 RepID=A0A923L397_9BACI|nr:sodium:solute symporter family protein [Ornithinibacillus hominis]MBC5635684.1 sodium:solute symporter family protein [Ornithinibacillus hominis]
MNWYLFWVITFIVLITAVGIYYSRKIKTADDYTMANFSLGFFPICGSIIATSLGSAAVIGSAGKGFEIGMGWFLTNFPVALFSILLVFVLGSTIRKLKLYTLPDLFVRRYGRASGIIPSLIISILYMTPTFGMQIVGMGAILSSIIDISLTNAMLLGFVISVAFTLMGGLPSVAWTDAVQSILILVGLIIMFLMGLHYVGGIDVVVQNTPKQYFDLFSMGTTELINYLIIFGPFYLVWQTTWQRISAAKTEKVAKKAISIGFIITFFIAIFSIGIGVIARQSLPDNTAPDLVYTAFLTEVFPPEIGGIFMVSLFAAVLTGATSFLLSGALNISKDIYQGWINPKADTQKVLKVSRLSVAGMAVLGLLVALLITDVIEIYSFALSLSAITMVMPVLAAMFWKRATKAGVISSVIGSLLVAVIWSIFNNPFGLHMIIPGLTSSIVILVIVSLLTKHSKDEHVTAYFYSMKEVKEEDLNSDLKIS